MRLVSEQVNADPDATASEPDGEGSAQGRRIRVGAAIAIALALGIVVWAVVASRGGDGSATPTATTAAAGTEPVVVSPKGLATLASVFAQPVYWLGERDGTRLELQQTAAGSVFVRYLPEGKDAGDAGAYLTVGTYPFADAFEATKSLAGEEGATSVPVGGGGVAFTKGQDATSVYAAFPAGDYQIEVFDPTPGAARALVAQGLLTPVAPAASTSVRVVTPGELRTFAAGLDQPLYWAGERSGTTLELSDSGDGKIYIRYLPSGVAAGDPSAQPTVATYALDDAFNQTKAIADQPGVDLIELSGGGVGAFESGDDVTNGYVAFPGSNYQIEVFDPTPGAARKLAASGKIVPVR